MLLICSMKFKVLKHRFWAFAWNPGGFRELREVCRKHCHLSWYLTSPHGRELWLKILRGDLFLLSTVYKAT